MAKTLFYSTPDGRAELYLGDAIEVMASFPDACVDAIVTDPPYALSFMGKEWDSEFNVSQSPDTTGRGSWIFGDTPYSQKRADYKGSPQAYQSWTTAWATEAYRILKPGAYMLVMGGCRTHHRLGCGLEDAGFEIKDELAWIFASGFPKNYDVSKGIDKKAGAKRKGIIRKGMASRPNVLEFTDRPVKSEYETGLPATPEAQYWEGYGTALKPAHEPIWLCKKPNEGTYVDNVLEHGCGAMNIEASRIAYDGAAPELGKPSWGGPHKKLGFDGETVERMPPNTSGRWPANVIVDCYPEEFIGGVVIEGESKPMSGVFGKQTDIRGGGFGSKRPSQGDVYAEQVRYGPKEASVGDGLLRESTRFFVIPKPSKKEKTCGGKVENKHVTVKPVRLGKWLIKLITPHQHPVVVLDPFCGSGSFLVSALELNHEGYQIEMWGIDKDEGSIETASARVDMAKNRLLQGVLL